MLQLDELLDLVVGEPERRGVTVVELDQLAADRGQLDLGVSRLIAVRLPEAFGELRPGRERRVGPPIAVPLWTVGPALCLPCPYELGLQHPGERLVDAPPNSSASQVWSNSANAWTSSRPPTAELVSAASPWQVRVRITTGACEAGSSRRNVRPARRLRTSSSMHT